MKILIMANQAPADLDLLTRGQCVAMLPVAGKPLLEHTLEAVTRLEEPTVKLDEITIVASRGVAELRHYVGNGKKWGLGINIVSSRPNADATSLKLTRDFLKSDEVMLIECDRLRSFSLSEFLNEARVVEAKIPDTSFSAVVDSQNGGLHLLKPSDILSDSQLLNATAVVMQHGVIYPVTNAEEFHRVNIAGASGEIKNLVTRGRERSLGLTTGFMTNIHPRCLKLGKLLAGNHCRAHSSSSFSGTVILNNGVVVDRNTSIENSVVLDKTFIGENLQIKNSILAGDMLIRVDTGAILQITDDFLAADLGDGIYETHFANITNRLLGLVLTLITLPLWPIAFLLAKDTREQDASAQSRLNKTSYVGNKAGRGPGSKHVFTTIEFNTASRLLKHFPLAINIAFGDIRLVGISLFTPEETTERQESWESTRDKAPAGALGPSQLYLAADASVDEKAMSDTIFSQQTSVPGSCLICWSAFRKLIGATRISHHEVYN